VSTVDSHLPNQPIAASGPALRLQLVDGLRGFAAVAVMLYHYAGRVQLPLSFLEWGYLGVAVFFTLSGFVIAMTVGDKPLSFQFLGRFALRRSLRLDIPYWASIATIILIAIFGARLGAHIAKPSGDQVLAHLVYLQDILGYQPLSSVYWSLCFEIQFYLFLVLLMMALNAIFGSLRRAGAALVIVGLVTLSLLERHVLHIAPHGLALVFWFNFALGSVAYWVLAGMTPAWCLYACGAVVLAAGIAFRDSYCWVALPTCALLYGAGRFGKMHWLSQPVFQFFGRVSYSMYIFHGIFGWYALSIAQKFCNDWIAFAVGIAAAVASAAVAYELLERPSIRLSRMVRVRPAAPAVQPAPSLQ
jgi:peptidoglycan/LPS O-acetylase OafA/YrhL